MNKKNIILTVLFSQFCLYIFAQNLVSNPSFEDTFFCPATFHQIDFAIGWTSYGRTPPDYFNACAISCAWPGTCLGIPQNLGGSQPALDGNAYAGIVTYDFEGGNIRAYFGTQLSNPLIIGEKYFVSAYISRGNDHFRHGATNNFGFRFSTILYIPFVNSAPTDNFSHVHDSIVIIDSLNWTKISGSFIADSAYQYLAIGNFYDDQNTDTLDIYPPDPFSLHNSAYYYVDYVCVSDDSLDCNVIDRINSIKTNDEYKLFPSPFSDHLYVKNEDFEPAKIIIFNIFSKKIFSLEFTKSASINTQSFATGIYFYEIIDKNGIVSNGKIIKQ